MKTGIVLSMGLALTLSVNAVEPRVEEKTLPDGLTELRVVSEAGKDLAVYKVDLKTRHEPATNRTQREPEQGFGEGWPTPQLKGILCLG